MTVTEGFLSDGGVFDEPTPAAPLGDPADCSGQDAEAGLLAWHQLLNHATWRRLRWIRETSRARAHILERWPEPDPRIIAAALGWSVGMAASRIELADGALERMPRLGEAIRDGDVEESKATKFVVGLRDVDDEQARTIVDALIDKAPGLGVHELEQRIAEAVNDVDADGAENRRKAAVARARVRTRTAPSGAVEIHGMDLDPQIAEPAFERIVAIADEVSGRLKAAGTDVPLSRVQAHVYLRLLHGCPAGNDDLSIADHVTEELLDPPKTEDDGEPDDGCPDDVPDGPGPDDGPDDPDDGLSPVGDLDDEGLDDEGPDDEGPDDDDPGDDGGPDGGSDGPDDGPAPDDGLAHNGGAADDVHPRDHGDPKDGPGSGGPGPAGSPEDSGHDRGGSDDSASASPASPAGLPDLDRLTGRLPADAEDDARDGDSPGDDTDLDSLESPTDRGAGGSDERAEPEAPPPWQPGDPPPAPPPDDTVDPTISTGDPPPPLTARLTSRGLEFRAGTLRTSLFTVLGLGRAHGRNTIGALCGGDAHALAWARTCAQFRVLLHDPDGHLEWVLLVRAPHLPGADPRYRRQVVELTAHTADLDALDVDRQLVGHVAELARRTQAALAAQRARPPEEHPARTTADAGRRFPGAELTRYVHARDRTCRFPMCTVPAVACHLDHTHDWLLHGPTQADNLGALSVGDHLRKHDVRSGWTVEQPAPGTFVWTSPTGTQHVVEPEPYRSLRPIPRAKFDHGITDTYEPRTQRPWRPRTDKHGHITDAARATLDDIDRRRRERHHEPPNPFDDDPPF